MPPPTLVTFPLAGTETIRANEAGAVVDAAAQQMIICTITVEGGMPAFVFTRDSVTLQDARTTAGHPKKKYQWVLSHADGTLTVEDAAYTLVVSFAGAFKYTYVMELCDAVGARLVLLKDVDYESAEPTDIRAENILIGTV